MPIVVVDKAAPGDWTNVRRECTRREFKWLRPVKMLYRRFLLWWLGVPDPLTAKPVAGFYRPTRPNAWSEWDRLTPEQRIKEMHDLAELARENEQYWRERQGEAAKWGKGRILGCTMGQIPQEWFDECTPEQRTEVIENIKKLSRESDVS